jgi:hypothetical protein
VYPWYQINQYWNWYFLILRQIFWQDDFSARYDTLSQFGLRIRVIGAVYILYRNMYIGIMIFMRNFAWVCRCYIACLYNFAFLFFFQGIGIKFCRHNPGKGRNSGIIINEDSYYVWLKTLEKFILSSREDFGSPQWYLRDQLYLCCTKDKFLGSTPERW